MTVRQLLLTGVVASALTATTYAQQPTPPPAPQTQPTPNTPPPSPRPSGEYRPPQPVNVKVDVTITDRHGDAVGLKKTLSVVAADTLSGRIRSNASYTNLGEVPLNVDTNATILAEGKIRVQIDLQYDLPGAAGAPGSESAGALRRTSLRENFAVIVDNGKPLVVAQSADPVGDRQVTIEVRATVLR